MWRDGVPLIAEIPNAHRGVAICVSAERDKGGFTDR